MSTPTGTSAPRSWAAAGPRSSTSRASSSPCRACSRRASRRSSRPTTIATCATRPSRRKTRDGPTTTTPSERELKPLSAAPPVLALIPRPPSYTLYPTPSLLSPSTASSAPRQRRSNLRRPTRLRASRPPPRSDWAYLALPTLGDAVSPAASARRPALSLLAAEFAPLSHIGAARTGADCAASCLPRGSLESTKLQRCRSSHAHELPVHEREGPSERLQFEKAGLRFRR